MSNVVTFGGDRLGTGAGFSVSTRTYDRSTHDLGKVFKSNLGVGMIMPFHADLMKRGDVWEFDLTQHTLTHPTSGPVFGSYEQRIAIFTADMRLYNRQLHNNKKGIGNNMKNVIFPKMRLNAQNINQAIAGDWNAQQINQSSILATTGVRGLGRLATPNGEGRVEIQRNAMWLLTYYETYSEYFANKQEEIGMVITAGTTTETGRISGYFTRYGDTTVQALTESYGSITTVPTRVGANATWRLTTNGDLSDIQIIWTKTSASSETKTTSTLDEFNWNQATRTNWGWELEGPTEYPDGDTIGSSNAFYIWPIDGETAVGPTTRFIDILTSIERTNELRVQDFPLSNIDDVREEIFAQPNSSPYMLGYYGDEDKGYPYRAAIGQDDMTEGVPNEESKIGSHNTWGGLCVATHKADRWQTWLNPAWIDNVDDISSVDTTGGSFSMNALSISLRIWNLNNDIVARGGSYQDWLVAVDGIESHTAPEMPVYRGGASCTIAFNEVVSSSEYSDQPLGTLGGQGVVQGKKGGHIKFKAEDNGIVLGVVWIIPHIDYYQGNKWFTKLETMDDLHKPAFDAIGYQDKTTDQVAAWDTVVGTDGTETFKSLGKEPAWTQYMTNNNENYGSFTRLYDERYMVLHKDYIMAEDGSIENATTYVDPTAYLYPFAYTGLDYGPFWVQIGMGNCKVRRLMSGAKQPHLMI